MLPTQRARGNCGKDTVAAFKIKETLTTMASILSFSTKNCPYCAETIKRRAVVCRYCGYDLRTGKPTRPSLAALQVSEDGQLTHNQDSAGTAGTTLGCGVVIVGALLFLGVCAALILFFKPDLWMQ